MKFPSAFAAITLLLGGCTADKPDAQPMPMDQTVFGEQVKQLERAREQAGEMERRMDQLDRQLEGAGQ